MKKYYIKNVFYCCHISIFIRYWSIFMKNLIQVKIKQEELEKLMATQNLTRSELAPMIPVANSWLTRIITGNQPVSPKMRNKF